MMDHDLHKCDNPECRVCSGSLALCETCGGAEASMPTDCPGVRMTGDQEDEIVAGKLDFVDGEWRKR